MYAACPTVRMSTDSNAGCNRNHVFQQSICHKYRLYVAMITMVIERPCDAAFHAIPKGPSVSSRRRRVSGGNRRTARCLARPLFVEAIMKSLVKIKRKVDSRAVLIGAAGHHSLPTYGHTEDGARPHIEVDSRGYHFVVVERGQELSRFTTHDLDDLLNQVFRTVTFSLACDYELAHRIETQDSRRLLFQREVELLSHLSPSWGQRRASEHQHILREHPFDDQSAIRARR